MAGTRLQRPTPVALQHKTAPNTLRKKPPPVSTHSQSLPAVPKQQRPPPVSFENITRSSPAVPTRRRNGSLSITRTHPVPYQAPYQESHQAPYQAPYQPPYKAPYQMPYQPPSKAPPPHHQATTSLDSYSSNNGRRGRSVDVADDTTTTFTTNKQFARQSHTRARSASAVVYTSRYDNNLLKPASALAPRRSPKMVAAADPGPAFVPVTTPGPSRDSRMMNMDRQSSFGAINTTTTTTSQKARSTRVPPPIAPGSYAQFDNRPQPFQRPSSSSSSTSGSSVMTRESIESRMRSPASSRTSFESWDSSPRKGEFSAWNRPSPIKTQFRRRLPPGELFAVLPGEVMQLILDHLGDLHLEASSISCATCMMRDFCSVALSARKLLPHARMALYENIQLVGNDSAVQKKRYKLNAGTRLVLLRRTLRANPQVSAMVHTLKVPAAPAGVAVEEYQNLVASVIMACPNFERLVGPISTYDHTWNRLHHALSTRWKLKEMNWVVGPSPYQRQRRIRSNSSAAKMMTPSNSQLHAPPGDLQPQQSMAFLDFNTNWSRLKTLSIHCLPGATLTPLSLVETMLAHMPNIEHLYLSNLPLTSFDDSSLLALPSLKTLWLSNLPGITSAGLSSFATRQSAQSITALTLKDLNIDSLPALVRIFSNLVSLDKFSFVQNRAPVLPPDEMIWLFPYLASKSIRSLHWDIPVSEVTNAADPILAKSIGAGGFPSLRLLRTPSDADGMFQSLCMPVEKIELASDRFHGRGLLPGGQRSGPSSPTMPTHNMQEGHAAAAAAAEQSAPFSRSLHHARLAAQTRIEAARSRPRYFVNVIDEDGSVVEKYGMSGYMGQVESKIRYHLLPDAGATNENGGLVDMADMLSDGGEVLGDREGCSGRWNANETSSADKRDRERWWHTERGRWRQVGLA